MVQANAINYYSPARWVVSKRADEGTHTTIAEAIADAVSGETVFVMPGTYNEDLALVAGIHISAFPGEGILPTVLIVGKASFAAAGTVIISGVRLQTGRDFFLSVTGTAVSNVYLNDCFLNCTNNTGIEFSSNQPTSSIRIRKCLGDIGTTLITLFVSTSAGQMLLGDTTVTNSGNTLLPSSSSAGQIGLLDGEFDFPFSVTDTAYISTDKTLITTGVLGVTCIETAGTGISTIIYTFFDGGAAAALTVGSGTTVRMTGQNVVVSEVADGFAVTGAGTIYFSPISFPRSAKGINVSTQHITPVSNVLISAANTGEEMSCQVQNSSNTASSNATLRTLVGGASSGDPTVAYEITSTQDWIHGVDNSATDKFVLAASTALGTNNVIEASVTGEINYHLQPAFAANQHSSATNATGDGSIYVLGSTVDLTEIFDQGGDFDPTTGVFTAPVSGRYQFLGNIWFIPGPGNSCTCRFITSSHVWSGFVGNPNAMKENSLGVIGYSGHCFTYMEALDTAHFEIFQDGGTKTATIYGDIDGRTWFSGNLET